MLKMAKVVEYEYIDGFDVRTIQQQIKIYLVTGNVDDSGNFVRVGNTSREVIISNIPEREDYKNETRIVSIDTINLSEIPIGDVSIKKADGTTVIFTLNGQIVTCENVVEGENLTVTYYYHIAAQNWFDQATQLMGDSNKNLWQIIGEGLWTLLLAMGEVEGELV